jgi:nitroreductase
VEFCEVIETRRSVRAYRPDPVPDSVLDLILEAARIAPSGSNRQPWRFIVVSDAQARKELVPLCEDQGFVGEAPIVIAACGFDIKYNRGSWMGNGSMLVDVAIAMDHLTLAARNEGLGTCWIGSFDNEGIKSFLGIPKTVQVVALTPLGYPKDVGVFRPTDARKSIDEIVCRERWC